MPGIALTELPAASAADVWSAGSAVLFVLIGLAIRKIWSNDEQSNVTAVANDLLKGASFFPFLLLAMSVWHNRYLEMLLSTNRLVLFLSGCIAGLYVAGEFVRQAQGKTDNEGGVED